MSSSTATSKTVPPLGALLREYRGNSGMSQLDLALAAETSARHLSFVETGRAKPSPALLARLGETLDLPLRDRNALLLAAGFAPRYPERGLDDDNMALVRRALDHLLRANEPYPALVINAHWDLYMANQPAQNLLNSLGLDDMPGGGAPNLLRLLMHPDGLRNSMVDWEDAARILLRRARNEELHRPNEARRRLIAEVAGYPGVPTDTGAALPGDDPLPVLTITFERNGVRTSWFTMVTTFGTPQDVTLQELAIECFFPADTETEAAARAAAAGATT